MLYQERARTVPLAGEGGIHIVHGTGGRRQGTHDAEVERARCMNFQGGSIPVVKIKKA